MNYKVHVQLLQFLNSIFITIMPRIQKMFNIGSRTILKKVKKDFYILEISPIKQLKIVNIILFKIKNPSNRAIIHAGIL